jgi:hypothetical protein
LIVDDGSTKQKKMYQWSMRVVSYGTRKTTEESSGGGEGGGISGASGGGSGGSDSTGQREESSVSNAEPGAIMPCTITLGRTMTQVARRAAKVERERDGQEEEGQEEDVATIVGGDPKSPCGQWEECPASFFNVRAGPTITEYKRTKRKIQSPNSMYEVLTCDLNQTCLKPSHINEKVRFDEKTIKMIEERHQLCVKNGLTIPTVLFVTWEMPK